MACAARCPSKLLFWTIPSDGQLGSWPGLSRYPMLFRRELASLGQIPARVRATMGVVQNRPIRTPGVANEARSEAMARSHVATS